MTIEIPYTGNLPWLVDRTILYVIHGSRAYGTNRPDSDYDYKGVAVPPRPYRDGFLLKFNQAIQSPDKEQPEGPDNADMVIYGLQKFMKLAAECNPNIIEVLWVDDADVLLCTEAGRLLREHRVDFLSQKALHTFRGYSMAQLRRIETHRKYLLNPPVRPPTRKEFGLPERTVIPKDQLGAAQAKIQKKLDSWEVDFGDLDAAEKIYISEQVRDYLAEMTVLCEPVNPRSLRSVLRWWRRKRKETPQSRDEKRFWVAGRLLGYDDNFLEYLDQEKKYGAAKRYWKQYKEWKTNRNPARAALEAKYGFDGKHGMHLVRLMRMCREILLGGAVRVRRPDAEDLKGIRNGDWSYDRMMGWANGQDHELVEIGRASDLPKKPNRVALDKLCQHIMQMLPDE